jgi:nucleotide-binding universal stress UspA family protein
LSVAIGTIVAAQGSSMKRGAGRSERIAMAQPLRHIKISRRNMAKLFEKILCAVDFDQSSAVVLHFAREIAEQNAATLCVLHVTPLPLNATEFSPIPMDPYPVWEKTARVELEKLVAAHLKGRGVAYKIDTRSGEAADGILTQAEEMDADLIVLATHGRKGVSHFLIGSVAERVIRRSPRPVLVVRPKEVTSA